ncbi:MAG: aldo/keto reductase [Burkholderiales bacterium]|nr:aldo/keto reductase [Burkholderiales bacterium]
MGRRRLGRHGPESSALGLGCMAMSGVYGPADRAESLATLHEAVDAGIDLIDTGDFYAMGHNEMLIGEALRSIGRERVQLSLKFGAQRDPAGAWLGFDARPAALKTALAYSLQRLGTDHVDIYRPARLDPQVPIEDTVGAIADLVRAGWVRHVGLSEVGSETLRRAAAVHPICDLQIEYSLLSRDIEASILPTCRELGIAVTAYGVLSRGLIGGAWSGPGPGDWRAAAPRFADANLAHNQRLLQPLHELAAQRGASVAQLALAWVLSRGEDIVPLLGSSRRVTLRDALQALRLQLDEAELRGLDAAFAPGVAAGGRYAPAQLAHLDSARG